MSLTLETTGVPAVPSQFNFARPVKRIHDSQALQAFHQSTALSELQQSLGRIVVLVEGCEIPQGVLSQKTLYTEEEIERYSHDLTVPIPSFGETQRFEKKAYVTAVCDLLERMSTLVDQVPPLPGPRRYGNMACRDWHDKLEAELDGWMKELIVPLYKHKNPDGFVEEVGWYIANAFGSRERLDFGTGHELSFLAFLTGLWKTRVLPEEVNGEDFLVMFSAYYELVRKLILTYSLEPAGSHGVWGLDDHFHIIYILGASQNVGSSKNGPTVSPKMVNNRSVVFQYSTRNLYFNAIAFIYKVKKGAFFEHSPILYDVSNVKSWDKILKGMLKMYQAEVLSKFPVVQHFYFGAVLFPWTNAKNGQPLPITAEESVEQEKEKKDAVHITAAPWKKQQTVSLQEELTKNSTRAPPPTVDTTRAPWATAHTSKQDPPTTKAPWAK